MKIEVHRHTQNHPWTYPLLDQRQREIAHELLTRDVPTLLLSEVASIITRGRRTPDSDLITQSLPPISELNAGTALLPHDTLEIDRGGLATYHGPGQWIAFPVHRLENSVGDPRGIRKIICKLLEVAKQVGQIYSEEVEIRSGNELGVWTPKGKFAAVGVHIENGVLLHGLAINGFQTPESFQGLRPCGLDLPVAYLLSEKNEDHFLQLKGHIAEAVLRELSPRERKRSDW